MAFVADWGGLVEVKAEARWAVPGRPRRRASRPGSDPERTTFGLNLLEARLSQNRTQRDVAKAAGTTHQYVSLVERGRASLTYTSMTKLAKAVGRDVADLLKALSD